VSGCIGIIKRANGLAANKSYSLVLLKLAGEKNGGRTFRTVGRYKFLSILPCPIPILLRMSRSDIGLLGRSSRQWAALVCPTLFIIFLTGCVSVPPVRVGKGGVGEDIFSHVTFLCQPQLNGREPRTAGSRAARHYIESRFKAYGLLPWGHARGYEHSFGYGCNVVGFLPGSDPKLSNEIVLVSAHYDHLGKNPKGQVCAGAADNAAGVAALLDTAYHLTSLHQRPRRSLLFVAFDCEEWMLFGSFAFSAQADVQSAKIAAVVNMDILGRDLLDVVPNTLFMAASDSYPELRRSAIKLGNEAGIRVLPLGATS